ncbi:MAG: hypothetical protein ACR2MD_15720 [Aridibacter sp.]|jgi:hypothetical protein
MKLSTRVICLFLLLLSLVFFAFHIPSSSQSIRSQNRVTQEAERITGDNFRYSGRTPKGAKLIAVNKPTRQMVLAIDKGFGSLINIAQKNGYYRNTNYSEYTVYIAESDRTKDSSGNYSPDIAIGAAQYKGTEYDQGGYIYVAGMVVAFNPNAFVIAEHQRNFQRVSDVVRYEGEHLVLYHNDRNLYRQTADHSKGGRHPILK